MAWHKLADRLKMAYQECQQKHTASDFIRWKYYIEKMEEEGLSMAGIKAQLALLALLVRQFMEIMSEKHPKRFSLDEFQIRYEKVQKGPIHRDNSPRAIKKRTENSKAFWFASLGIDSEGNFLEEIRNKSQRPPRQPKE